MLVIWETTPIPLSSEQNTPGRQLGLLKAVGFRLKHSLDLERSNQSRLVCSVDESVVPIKSDRITLKSIEKEIRSLLLQWRATAVDGLLWIKMSIRIHEEWIKIKLLYSISYNGAMLCYLNANEGTTFYNFPCYRIWNTISFLQQKKLNSSTLLKYRTFIVRK